MRVGIKMKRLAIEETREIVESKTLWFFTQDLELIMASIGECHYYDNVNKRSVIIRPFRRCRETGEPQHEVIYRQRKRIHIVI